jgi:hypothetical protein
MFIIPKDKIEFIKENGLYDYILDKEDEGLLNKDDKEDIYQYVLANAMDYMTNENYNKFIDGLVEVLNLKRECELGNLGK